LSIARYKRQTGNDRLKIVHWSLQDGEFPPAGAGRGSRAYSADALCVLWFSRWESFYPQRGQGCHTWQEMGVRGAIQLRLGVGAGEHPDVPSNAGIPAGLQIVCREAQSLPRNLLLPTPSTTRTLLDVHQPET